MQSTQFINSVGQMGTRDVDDFLLTPDSALPGLITFQQAYDLGLIELDKPFRVRASIDDDNWYIAQVIIESAIVTALRFEDTESPASGSVPEDSVVEVRAVLTAGQLEAAFSSLAEPLTEIYDVTESTTIDDAYWDDSVSEGGPRYIALDTALLANSPTPITLTLGGGSLGYYRIFDIVQTGVGAVTIAPDAGFTVNGGAGSVVISAQWKKARVYFRAGTDFVVVLD